MENNLCSFCNAASSLETCAVSPSGNKSFFVKGTTTFRNGTAISFSHTFESFIYTKVNCVVIHVSQFQYIS